MNQYRLERTLSGKPIKDERKRKGDRHKAGRKHSGGEALSKWDRRVIVAWDGEGANLDTGEHVYNLLSNSNGDYILNHDGLSTIGIFEFLFTHYNKRDINVIYGGSYDVNMILRDLPKQYLKILWDSGEVYWSSYKIMYAPRKKFSVTRFYHRGKELRNETFVLWDVLGYFQTSFVVAYRKWLGDLPILDSIEDMKHQRSGFAVEDIKSIIQYNQHECNLLVKLVESLFSAMDEGDIRLSRYDGAGSIAAALLRKYRITDHMGDVPSEVKRWAQYGYSGGWIEAMKIGTTPTPTKIYRYDINSAYPSAAMMLPSYDGAVWERSFDWNGSPSSLVRVKWHFDEQPFYPLFYREPDGSIIHPRWGEGIYYGIEIEALKAWHPDQFEIIEAYNVYLANDVKPFGFIDEVYNLRLMYKSMGSMASEALKLGMNSIYGKLAQQAGAARTGRIPQYHHLLWAGEITARTRMKLFWAARQKPQSVIAFATDAIIGTEPLVVPCGEHLGEWTDDVFDGITIIQPGVYFLRGQEDWSDKYRGFDKGALIRSDIIEAWRQGKEYHANLTRFVTMGSALQSKDFAAHWRHWETHARKLDIFPTGKRVAGQDTCFWERLCDTLPVINMHLELLSMPYPLEWVHDDWKPPRPDVEGVDMKILEQEYLDAYA